MSGNRTVFIGNIPYGVSEDIITQTLERVGQVNHFRLVYDKETGKPKGFGFAEYADADQAAAAVRNLNDYELNGRRLRVDYSNDGKDNQAPGQGNTSHAPVPPPQQPPIHLPPMPMQINGQPPIPMMGGDGPALPEGQGLGQHLTAQDAISETVAAVPPLQLLDAMQQMQELCRADPDKATLLLKQAPQLAYAITQVLILMKLVDQGTLASVIQQTATAQPPGATPVQQLPPPRAAPPPQAHPAYPSYQQTPPQPYAPTPPMGMPYQPPPQPQAPPPQPSAVPDQNALIQQVLAMTKDQIDSLAPNDRAQIVALRAQLGAPVPGY